MKREVPPIKFEYKISWSQIESRITALNSLSQSLLMEHNIKGIRHLDS